MNEKKVLFITRKYPPMKGGMESYSYNLVSNYEGDFVLKALGKKQIHLLWFYPYCLLYVLFHARSFDVIHLGDMLLCGVGWLAKKRNPAVKVVATIHGLDITYSNPIYRLYLKWFSHGLNYHVADSSYTKEIAMDQGYSPCGVIAPAPLRDSEMPAASCTKEAFCRKYGLPEDVFIVSTVGRLVKRKGVEWFIRNVLPTLNNPKFVYLVVGCGEMESAIRETICELHEDRVKMLGRVSDQEIIDIYTYSDVFLMPNINVENDVEGYGIVAVEAAAAGCLVIAANLQGITDAVKDGVSGILYEPESVQQLTDLMTDVMEHYEKYQTIKKAAQNYVSTECTGKAIAARYKVLMHNV